MERDAARLVEETVWEGFRAYAAAPGVELCDTADLRRVLTGSGYEGLNGVLRAPADDVAAALEPFRRRAVPMLWHVGPLEGPELDDALLAAGLRRYEEEPTMVAALTNEPPAADAPAGLAIRPVRDEDTLRTWVQVWTGSTAATLPQRLVELRAATGFAAGSAFEHLLGTLDGDPAATAAVAHGSSAAEIQHVVTLEPARRRGIGTAMTIAALELARGHGHTTAVLTASELGVRLYEQLGFRCVGLVRRYFWHPSFDS
ncbi:MAG TPA: GNAT family N-acetyltransferase [Gaiellaceae bacterium]